MHSLKVDALNLTHFLGCSYNIRLFWCFNGYLHIRFILPNISKLIAVAHYIFISIASTE